MHSNERLSTNDQVSAEHPELYEWSRDQRELISSERIEGTPVYGRDDDNLGSIHNFMVEKRGGLVAYAVIKCANGSVDGGGRFFPLAWSELEYDERLHGYRVEITEDDLERRRSLDAQGHPINSNQSAS